MNKRNSLRYAFRIAVGIIVLGLVLVGGAGAKSISDDATGGDCTSFGTWDTANKTCTITSDLADGMLIDSDGITLDGSGHNVTGRIENFVYEGDPGCSICLGNRTGVTIKNLYIKDVVTLSNSSYNNITNTVNGGIIVGGGEIAINEELGGGSNNYFIENTIIGTIKFGAGAARNYLIDNIIDGNINIGPASPHNYFKNSTVNGDIYISSSSGNNAFIDNSIRGKIHVDLSSGQNISGNTIYDDITLWNGNAIILNNKIFLGNISIGSGSPVDIRGNIISSGGIYVDPGMVRAFANIIDNTINSSNTGIYINPISSAFVTGNTVNSIGPTIVGITSSAYSENKNTIYNNYFNSTKGFEIINNVPYGQGFIWNTTKTSGRNIVGGPYLGGNVWAYPNGTGLSQTCADLDIDGICDNLTYLLDSNNTDYLPLAYNIMPPAGVTNLANISYAMNYINWTWTDPSDPDVEHVEIYLNNSFKTNVSSGNQSYTATNLTPGTQYTIGTKTVDNAGNVNASMVTAVATTAADTTAPVITLNGNNTVNVEAGTTYTEAGAIVTDNYETGLSATITGSFDTEVVGSYMLPTMLSTHPAMPPHR
ncbi:MAG: NosD domain-containing protein [Candidatus Methanoperedens sp.]|nr:NosD domain-containing protein [Candidatus Methanoperedens sp.]